LSPKVKTGRCAAEQALFGWLYFWLILMLMLICCERKTLFHDWLIFTDKLKRTEMVPRAT
jgi:hypothetical protein